MKTGVKLEFSGPLFRGGTPFNRGNTKFIAEAAQGALQELMEMGEERLAETLRVRPAGVFLSVGEARPNQSSTGHYRRSISGKIKRLFALITDGGGIYGPWLEGTDERNKTTRFKGYGSFRKVKDWLNGKARGILEKHVRRVVRKMNGGL